MVKNKDVFTQLEKWAPKNLAFDWDPVGLQIGDESRSCKKILVTLDVLEPVVDEAIKNDIDLIVAHHPLIFQPLKNLNLSSSKGKVIEKLIKHNITVYASHTNLDIANGGVNDLLANALNLQNINVLLETNREKLFKFVVFVPNDYESDVREAICNAGAGQINDYSHCTYRIEGQGTFKPLEGSNPFIGDENCLTKVDEIRLETIVKEKNIQNVVKAAKNAHPYEEMAFDIYPLEIEGDPIGLGRVGDLHKEQSLNTFIKHLKKQLDLDKVRVVGNLDQSVKRVAILGGSGEKYYEAAYNKGADVYITGDVTFHPAQEAEALGITVIDAGHYIEKIIVDGLFNYLKDFFNEEIEIYKSKINTDPFHYV